MPRSKSILRHAFYLCALVTFGFALSDNNSESLDKQSSVTSVYPESRSLDVIYAAALKENGTLRVSWGGDAKHSGDVIVNAFTTRFPGVKLNLTVDLSKYHDSRADRTYETSKGKDDGVDVIVLQTMHDFARWKLQGRLLSYKVARWNDIQAPFVDKDGFYTGIFIFQFGDIIFNPDKVASTAVPTAFNDFLNPEWTNKLVLTYPNDDDAILFLFKLIVDKYGWTFIDSLNKQGVTWVRGTARPTLLLAKPSSQNELAASFSAYRGAEDQISVKIPTDPFASWPQTGAIFASTKVPETAKLFLNFLLDDELQAIFSTSGFSTRKAFDTKGILNQTLTDPLAYIRFMGNRENVEWWKLQFETTFGTPQGLSPLEDDP